MQNAINGNIPGNLERLQPRLQPALTKAHRRPSLPISVSRIQAQRKRWSTTCRIIGSAQTGQPSQVIKDSQFLFAMKLKTLCFYKKNKTFNILLVICFVYLSLRLGFSVTFYFWNTSQETNVYSDAMMEA